MSDDLTQEPVADQPRKLVLKRKPMLRRKAARAQEASSAEPQSGRDSRPEARDAQPGLPFDEQEGRGAEPKAQPHAPASAETPVAASAPAQSPAPAQAPARPQAQEGEALPPPEIRRPRQGRRPRGEDAGRQGDEARGDDQTSADERPRQESRPDSRQEPEDAGDERGYQPKFKGGRQRGGRNNGYQYQKPYRGGVPKKSVSMEDVCLSYEEYQEHSAGKLLVSDLARMKISDLKQMLSGLNGNSPDSMFEYKRQDVIFEILRHHAQGGGAIYAVGTLEVLGEGFGFLRSPENSYLPGPEDVFVSSMHIKYLNLKTGDTVEGMVRTPKENEKYFAISKIALVNDEAPVKAKTRVPFDSLTPLYPDKRINLEVADPSLVPALTGMSSDSARSDVSMRIINMFCPIGKGQRALITAPPRTGKTILLQQIANSITANHPEVALMVLLVDERPEEVTDMKRNVKGEVISSTFDEQASRHVQVAEMVIEKAKRLVEHKRDVVILLDSITRLARAYNQTVPASGKILSGGVDSNALHKPKRFFGAARNVEEGGSLTIIASALIETGSRMDEVIFEEFKGTGNCEIVLDRRMSDRRIYPAINIKKSGTRREELLLDKDEAARIWILRNAVNDFEDVQLIEFLIDKIRKTQNNEAFLRSMNPGVSQG